MSAFKFINWFEEQYGKGFDKDEYIKQQQLVVSLSIQLEQAEAKLNAMKKYNEARTAALYGWSAARKHQ